MLIAISSSARTQSFDHAHSAFDALLAKHVRWLPEGHASVVDYAALAHDRPALERYLASLSAVSRTDFERWNKPQRRAFLVNAYNAYTLQLVLTKYPDLESIKDLGGFFSSPWKQRFFTLLGESRHLDDVEHSLLRGAADYDDPRIHFAVNCASVGCPALRPEAFRAEVLDAQLDDQTRRFLADRSRNRAEPEASRLVLSPVFDWYEEDFSQGWRGARSVAQFVATYPVALGLSAADIVALQRDEWSVGYGDYDWSLNRSR
ncbi:MAG: DUF547 domain-containing protein [Xanthomonadales bacterium]|nr:DUF547 domain-containing protein [Xanthomonadales bacterium]